MSAATPVKTRTQNTSIKKTSIGRTPVTPSSEVCALVVRIGWTDAPVVTITARKQFDLSAVTIDTRNGARVSTEIIVRVPVDTVVYFVKSSFPGFYYISHVNASGVATCTCGHYQNLKNCKHQPLAEGLYQAKVQRVTAALATIGVTLEAAPDEDIAPADALKTATPEERTAIWKSIAKREKQLERERVAAYWDKIHALQEAAKRPEGLTLSESRDALEQDAFAAIPPMHRMTLSQKRAVEEDMGWLEDIDEEARIDAYLKDELALGA
jgi:hypothetical protein